MSRYSGVEVFHGEDLDECVDRAIETCPLEYVVYDMDISFINNEYVVIAKIKKDKDDE